MLEKAAALKRFQYSKTDIVKKQYQKLDDTDEFDRIKKEKPTTKKYNRSNLIYKGKHSYYEYCNNKIFNSSSLESKYPFLLLFYSDLNKCNNLNPQKESTKEKSDCI